MKPLLLLLSLVFLVLPHLSAQETRLVHAAKAGKAIEVVLMAEGYTAAQKEQFFTDASSLGNSLLTNEAFAPYASHVRVLAIYVESNESGSDIPRRGVTADTYFSSTFGYNGVDRLLYFATGGGGYNRAVALLQTYAPSYSLACILVNSTEYGGAGGGIAFASMNSSSKDVLIHEVGHSFADLDDEYVDSGITNAQPSGPNTAVSTTSLPAFWNSLVLPTTPLPTTQATADANWVGAWAGASYRDYYYRATYNSTMRALGQPFGPVNLKAFLDAANVKLGGNLQVAMISSPTSNLPLGSTTTLYALTPGSAARTYQWYKDGVALAGRTTDRLTLGPNTASDAALYRVEVSEGGVWVASAETSLSLSGVSFAPAFTVQPQAQTCEAGATATYSAAASGSPAAGYAWQRKAAGASAWVTLTDGGAYSGTNTRQLKVTGMTAAMTGDLFRCVATNARGQASSDPALLRLPGTLGNRLANLSTRCWVDQGVAIGVGGFVLRQPTVVLIRGAGPSLAGFGVPTPLERPRLTLYDSKSQARLSNEGWQNAPVYLNGTTVGAEGDYGTAYDRAALGASVRAFAFSSANDSALAVKLPAGLYTVELRGADGGSGHGLVELYFFRPDTDGLAGDRFVNLSTRCQVRTGFSIGVAGLVLEEGGRVLLRAAGKSLEPFGVTGTLPRPRIRVLDSSGAQIALSRGWKETPAKEAAISEASTLVQAFALTGPEDDALLIDLPKGLYTAEVQDADGASGNAIIEVYLVP